MALKITNSLISVQDAAGTDKFNSNDKLVYEKYSKTVSVTLSSANGFAYSTAITGPSSSTHFEAFNVTVTSCTGNIISSFINHTIPIAGGITTHVATGVRGTSLPWAYSHWLWAGTDGSNLILQHRRTDMFGVPGISNLNLTLTVTYILYSYT